MVSPSREASPGDPLLHGRTVTTLLPSSPAPATLRQILADNQPPDRMAALVRRPGAGITIQALGGITPEMARAYAEAGATLISVDALSHSAPAAPIRCEIEVAR